MVSVTRLHLVGRERKSSFEDLDCWKAARRLRRFARERVMRSLPREERFDLGDQISRAARSVTANIAEGYGRYHYRDEAKFLSISRGSASELLDHLIAAHDENMIPDDWLAQGRELVDDALRLINGYRAYVIRRANES